jgi:hypothetical protein
MITCIEYKAEDGRQYFLRNQPDMEDSSRNTTITFSNATRQLKSWERCRLLNEDRALWDVASYLHEVLRGFRGTGGDVAEFVQHISLLLN